MDFAGLQRNPVSHRTILIAILIPVSALLVLTLFLNGFGVATAHGSSQAVGSVVMKPLASCADAQANTLLKNCISVASTSDQPISVASCNSVTIPLTIRNEAGNQSQVTPLSSLTLSFKGNGEDTSSGYILNGGTHMVGSVVENGTEFNLNQFMSYSPSILTVQAGHSGQTELTISIPCSFPEELVGQPLQFEVVYSVQGINTAQPSNGVFGAQSTLEVTVS